jgi:hypothetical protein
MHRRSRPGSRCVLSAQRKVRAPQGRMPANGRASRGDGKCNRKIPPRSAESCRAGNGPAQTPWEGKRFHVPAARVKWCRASMDVRAARRGASPVRAHPPGGNVRGRQTPSGARPNRGAMAWPAPPPGRLLEAVGNHGPRGMAVAGPRPRTEPGLQADFAPFAPALSIFSN